MTYDRYRVCIGLLILFVLAMHSAVGAQSSSTSGVSENLIAQYQDYYNSGIKDLTNPDTIGEELNIALFRVAKYKVLLNIFGPPPDTFYCDKTIEMIDSDWASQFTYYTILMATQDKQLHDWLVEELLLGRSFGIMAEGTVMALFTHLVGSTKYGTAPETVSEINEVTDFYRIQIASDVAPALLSGETRFKLADMPYVAGLLFLYFPAPCETDQHFVRTLIIDLSEYVDATSLILELRYLGWEI